MRRISELAQLVKLFFASIILYLFERNLIRKNIWLIREKRTEARDNGYHLFKYLRKEHPEIPVYYVITKDSADLHKIQPYGNIIFNNSLTHFIYYLAAKYSISSQPRGAVPYPDRLIYRFRKLCNKNQLIIFLQHGVTKDNLENLLDYKKLPFDLFCCSAERERDYVQKSCHYPDGPVQQLGFCRFDNLYKCKQQVKKQILVMPTFRSWLGTSNPMSPATEKELESFKTSKYYEQYISLLQNRKLLLALDKYGYTMVFYPHYAMQPYIRSFEFLSSEQIIIADRLNYDVQQLLIDSALMVTDYSSVFFDFAYMEKPELFFQFDEIDYRKNHYKEGYFDYRKDGFGPVVSTITDAVDYIIQQMKNNCKIDEIYRKRVNDFFTLRDDNNCHRTYEAIVRLGGKNND